MSLTYTLIIVLVRYIHHSCITGDQYDLFVANGQYIYSVHFQGSESDIVRFNEDAQNIGIDVHIELVIPDQHY